MNNLDNYLSFLYDSLTGHGPDPKTGEEYAVGKNIDNYCSFIIGFIWSLHLSEGIFGTAQQLLNVYLIVTVMKDH